MSNLITEEIEHIATPQDIQKRFLAAESEIIKIENYENACMTVPELNRELITLEESVRCLQMFSPNETLKEVPNENLRLLLIPYYRADVLGRFTTDRKQNVQLSKQFYESYLSLVEHYSRKQEEPFFPENLRKMWKRYREDPEYKITRDELIGNEKERRLLKTRYENSIKIKQERDERQIIMDWLVLNLYNAVNAIKLHNEELKMLNYKASLQNNEELKEKHEAQNAEPLPKLKVWNIEKPAQEPIGNQFFIPTQHPKCLHCSSENERKQLISKVWQPNSNQPTMTLEEVADLQMKNLEERTAREAKLREENKQDTDSEKEEVDAREKKKARAWDDWKDDHEKGAGNKNQY